jgi:NADH-quinone oxidoreductase subunit E
VVASAAPAAPAHSAAAPGPVAEPGGAQGSPATAPISERVRDAARAAGEAARAALGDAAPASAQPPAAGRPAALPAPQDGRGDDLKQIGGIGPKIEQRLHRIGIYHFHQIAGWGPAEVAWVDANLEDYKGRATRDNWVEQAKVLAAGDGKAQSQRRDRGEA